MTATVFATAQRSDILIYEGKEYFLHTNPLNEFLEKNSDIKVPETRMQITSLWRGYVATFEIRDGCLFIKDVRIPKGSDKETHELIWESVIDKIIKKEKDRRADWFSGLLVLPHGKIINYVHMGYASTFENYILLEIDKGKYVKERRLPGEAYWFFKKKQFELFRQTDEYKKLVEDLIKKGSSRDEAESFLEIFVIDYSKKILND
ncbi:hypothetical protein OH491_17110 [Termitidicoccus mucosus]